MQELSMNVLDIAQNSIRAKAKNVQITLDFNLQTNMLTLSIKDDGKGMDEKTLAAAQDPFSTSRTTRKVGLGLPLLKMAAQLTNGDVLITSKPMQGTNVTATFEIGHIDLAPLGDMPGSISALMQLNPDIDFIYTVKCGDEEFAVNTKELKEVLGDVSLSEPGIALWVKEYIDENTTPIIKRSNAI